MRSLCVLVLAPLLSGCATWFFSGEDRIDRSRPVALVETTGGVEYGATTEFGVLTLGRTETSGPCRVHYFLGPTPVIESGTLDPAGGVFTRATIDLKTQAARANDRPLRPEDELRVMWTPDGQRERSVRVARARAHGVGGEGLAPLAGFAKGRLGIVVSAGPSLRRNLHLLKDPAVQERTVIVATQTVLKPLLAEGIRPHFVA
ncbi:MAG: 6-hydroxymethylpterin diphosphokinase MptE-like protein, partial [Planctomycetota bacterium]